LPPFYGECGETGAKWGGGEAAGCAGRAGVEPLTVTDEPIAAAVKRPTVATFMRRGVSHVVWRVWSQERAPLAPAIAAIAQTAHMPGS
jgi:hypothetical protein